MYSFIMAPKPPFGTCAIYFHYGGNKPITLGQLKSSTKPTTVVLPQWSIITQHFLICCLFKMLEEKNWTDPTTLGDYIISKHNSNVKQKTIFNKSKQIDLEFQKTSKIYSNGPTVVSACFARHTQLQLGLGRGLLRLYLWQGVKGRDSFWKADYWWTFYSTLRILTPQKWPFWGLIHHVHPFSGFLP